MWRRHRLAVLLGAALLLRLAFAAFIMIRTPSLAGFHALDTPSYIQPAVELAGGLSFSIDGVPDIYRTPGYSLCLVPGIFLGWVELWAVLLNLLLSAGTVLCVHRIADRLFARPAVSLAAAGLYALDPLSIFHVSQVTSETVFTFLAVWCLDFLTRYLTDGPSRLRYLLAAAALIAAATLVRPISLYLPWALAAFLGLLQFARPSGGPSWKARLAHLALFLALSTGPVFAWQLRNTLAAGYPGVSAIVDVNAYYFQAAAVQARLEGRSMKDVRMEFGYERELHLTGHPRERTGDQARHFLELKERAAKILRPNWAAYLRIHIAGILKVLTNPGASGYMVAFNRDTEVQALAGVYPEGGAVQAVRDFNRMRPAFLLGNLALGLLLAAYWLAALRGMTRVRRAWQAGLTLLVLTAVYFAAVSGGANSVSRFRHPIMPLLCVFAGVGLMGRRSADSSNP